MSFGGQEFLIVLVIVLILFGGKKIPELMRGVGRGVGELQKGVEEGKKSFKQSLEDDERREEEQRRAEQAKGLSVRTPTESVSRQDDPTTPTAP